MQDSTRLVFATLLPGMICVPLALATPGVAQVIPDGTLGNEGSLVTPLDAYTDRIDGAALRDTLLFHSYEGFSIPTGQGVYFANPELVNTIFSRVTGADPSLLFGTLGVLGDADLMFINPNGIVFGPDAELDLNGAFTATTATGVVFPGGDVFSALEPAAAPLLTVNVEAPVGVVFEGTTPAPILNTADLSVDATQGIALIGGTIVNTGQLTAPGGQIDVIAVPESTSLSFSDSELTSLSGEDTPGSSAPALGELIDEACFVYDSIQTDFQLGTVAITGSVDVSNDAENNGRIALTGNRIRLLDGSITAEGIVGGQINLSSSLLENRGEIRVDGETGGTLNIDTGNFLDAGVLSATGSAGNGGAIQVDYDGTVIQTSSALTDVSARDAGGSIVFQGGRVLTTSGNLDANGELGGEVHLFGERLQLLATEVNASGDGDGGEILVGGDYQGNTIGAENALNTLVNHAATLEADALVNGDGGRVIVWADGETEFYGSVAARGGELRGNGGFLEVSGRENLLCGGWGDASAINGIPGEVLLDPKNFVIGDSSNNNYFEMYDPNPKLGNHFGDELEVLASGNIVISAPGDDLNATNSGAVYLVDSNTGSGLSAIYGTANEDRLGERPSDLRTDRIVALENNNYVILNPRANINGITNSGTVILVNGDTGNEINRISGENAIDGFGGSIVELENGNYVFSAPRADINGVPDVGTVILVNGNTGEEISRISGVNPRMGFNSADTFGGGDIISLSNGNYVFGNPNASENGIINSGTVILADGDTGEEINRISGDSVFDFLGNQRIVELQNGNFVFGSFRSDENGIQESGSVILVDGSTGGEISRIVGPVDFSFFGFGDIVPLENGNYVFENGTPSSQPISILADGITGQEIVQIPNSSPILKLDDGNFVVRERDGVGSIVTCYSVRSLFFILFMTRLMFNAVTSTDL